MGFSIEDMLAHKKGLTLKVKKERAREKNWSIALLYFFYRRVREFYFFLYLLTFLICGDLQRWSFAFLKVLNLSQTWRNVINYISAL